MLHHLTPLIKSMLGLWELAGTTCPAYAKYSFWTNIHVFCNHYRTSLKPHCEVDDIWKLNPYGMCQNLEILSQLQLGSSTISNRMQQHTSHIPYSIFLISYSVFPFLSETNGSVWELDFYFRIQLCFFHLQLILVLCCAIRKTVLQRLNLDRLASYRINVCVHIWRYQ